MRSLTYSLEVSIPLDALWDNIVAHYENDRRAPDTLTPDYVWSWLIFNAGSHINTAERKANVTNITIEEDDR